MADRSEYLKEYARQNRAKRREEQRSRLGIEVEKQGFVYFFLCRLSGKVKIGFTADIPGRLKVLNAGRPDDAPLVTLATIPGTQRLNKDLQDEIAEYSEFNRSGWYPMSDELMAVVDREKARTNS